MQRNKGSAPARTTTTQPGGDAALLESEPAMMIVAAVFAAAASAAPAAPVAPPSKPCVLHQPPPLRPSRCCSISVSAPLPGAASASSASSAALSGCWLLADAWCRRNILMLAVDDLRPLFGEAFGYPEVKTPNFDKNFLGEGLVFRTPLLPPHFCAQPLIAPRGPAPAGNSYVQVAVCGPSRSSILTGRRPDSSHINAALNSWCW